MANLPKQLTLDQLQTKWPAQLNPLLSNQLTQGLLITNQKIVSGANVIDHRLGRKLVGWIIVGINGIADIYDTQSTNQTPQLTLNLTSNADVTANLWCF